MTTNDQILDEGEAYLSFGGWAQKVSDPPKLHERRRYIVDVECTEAAIKTSEKGDRYTRKLSILRVSQMAGVVPPPKDEDENQGDLFDDDGNPTDEASADEGDEILAQRAEDAARAKAEADADVVDAEVVEDDATENEDWSAETTTTATEPAPDNVSPMFKAAEGE